MENEIAEDQELIREFLVESYENLSRLDQDLVELEKHPKDASLLASIFRTIHTIKGTCGFLAFHTLERITHQAESLLSQLRDGKRELTPDLVSLILETVDATRSVLASIEETGKEGPLQFEGLTTRLRDAVECKVEPHTQDTPQQTPLRAAASSGSVPAGDIASPAPAIASPAVADKTKEKKHGEDGRSSAEAKQPAARKGDDAERSSAAVDANIRVGVGLLDTLMDLVGELVLTRNQILQFNREREDPALNATSQRLNLITTELQEGVMKTRMQPIGVLWSKLPRVVRDIAVALGKGVELKMDGADTELDRTIIEAIKDPLVHLVRNSCDHGIEMPEVRLRSNKPAQGVLTLRAYHEGGQVNIEVGDDGAGIDVARVKQKAVENGLLRAEQAEKLSDREALNLIFAPGFSTAKAVTNLSGRGVGMDVVKSHIEKIGGVVDIFSRPGEGSTVKIRIPLTLAIIPGLVITSGGERFVIPQVSLLELIRLEGDSSGKHIEYVHGTPVYRRRGSLLPIAYLNQVLGLKPAEGAEALSLVVLQAEDRQFGLVVDGVNDTQEIVVKPLSKQMKGLTLYAGATIMGDGQVALILDVLGIGQRSGVFGQAHEPVRGSEKQAGQAELERQRLLSFKSGSFERLAVPLSLVARLEEFPRSMIEHAGGTEVVQYRDRILPLVSLRSVLEPGAADDTLYADVVQVVVFNDGDHSVGMVVDQILDVAEEAVTRRQRSTRRGLLGSAVVGKQVTDFLDLNAVIEASRKSWVHGGDRDASGKTILIVDPSSFSRGVVAGGLDLAGYSVLAVADAAAAAGALEDHPIDLIVVALEMPPDDSAALTAAVSLRPEWQQIPVLALTDSRDPSRVSTECKVDYRDCQSKFNQMLILDSVVRLTSLTASTHLQPDLVA